MSSGPERIFIVRHGERLDRVFRDWSQTSQRPHDTPLSDNGMEQGRALGRYLCHQRDVDPCSVVVLASPLVRCVQTAHAVIEGMSVAVAARESAHKVPLYVEHSLCEGAVYIANDIRRNPTFRISGTLPTPMLHDNAHLREHISHLVSAESPLGLGPTPEFVAFDLKKGALGERVSVSKRCSQGAMSLLAHPELDGKTVICVGHGCTTVQWAKSIVPSLAMNECPIYTGFVEIAKEAQSMVVVGESWACPHLIPEDATQ